MKLYELMKNIAQVDIPDTEVSGVTCDTRSEIKPGTVFVCIKGKTFDGHDAAKDMVAKGCSVVVCEKDLGLENQIIVEDTRGAYPRMCANWFGNPQDKLSLIGVTGTNGKTTITTMIKKVLTSLGCKVGLIGTCQNEIGDSIYPTSRTTPEPYDLYELFDKMVKAGCQYAVMEVSSQGLEQKRVAACTYQVGIFTNLTQDHLDVHGTMENYYLAKKELFECVRQDENGENDEDGEDEEEQPEDGASHLLTGGIDDLCSVFCHVCHLLRPHRRVFSRRCYTRW